MGDEIPLVLELIEVAGVNCFPGAVQRKVAAFMHSGSMGATGYVVDQTPQLADLPEVPRPGALDAAPPLGPFRTFQVPSGIARY